MLTYKFYIHVNSPASANENQLNCEKLRFSREWVKLTQVELFSMFHFKSAVINFADFLPQIKLEVIWGWQRRDWCQTIIRS